MLRIVEVAVRLIGPGMRIVEQIKKRSRSHADQLERSLPSIALNLAEGSGMSGGNRRERYRSALGSARESLVNVRVAEAAGWVRDVDGQFVSDLNHAIAVCVKLTR